MAVAEIDNVAVFDEEAVAVAGAGSR